MHPGNCLLKTHPDANKDPNMHALGLIHEKHKTGELRPSNNEVRQLLEFLTRDCSVESDDESSVYNPTQNKHRLIKISLTKQQQKYEHNRRRRVDEQVEHDTTISKRIGRYHGFGKFKRT